MVDEVLNNYEQYIMKRYSNSTRGYMKPIVKRYLCYCEEKREEYSQESVENFIGSRQITSHTEGRYRTTINTFFDYLESEGYVL